MNMWCFRPDMLDYLDEHFKLDQLFKDIYTGNY